MCSLERGIRPWETARLSCTPPTRGLSHTAFAVTVQRPPHLFPTTLSPILSLPAQSSWLHSSVLILSWSSGLFIYLACDEQLSLSNSSLNLAQPVPPAPTEPRHSQKSNPASCTACGALATSSTSPAMGCRIFLNRGRSKVTQDNRAQ